VAPAWPAGGRLTFWGKKKKRRGCPGAWSVEGNARLSAGDAVDPFAVLATHRIDGQPHFLAQRPADEPAYAVRLPAGRLHDLGERCATLTLEQAQDRGLLAAIAGCGGLAASFATFPLGSLGRLGLGGGLGLLALLCRCLGLVGPLRGRRGRFRRAAAVQALDRFPNPADRRLPVRALLDGREAGDTVPDLHQPVRRPLGNHAGPPP